MRVGDHALILGGSMAGLATAAALSDRFDRVTIVERDVLPDGAEGRRGVPQGRHGHALLPGGLEELSTLLPGLLDDLQRAGAETVRRGGHLRFHSYAGMLMQVEFERDVVAATRPLIEWAVRERVRRLPNVTFRDGHDIRRLMTAGHRVVGAVVAAHGRDVEEGLHADLVVDATGRGSRTPHWLAELGFPVPETDEVHVDVRYTTRFFRSATPPGGAKQILVTGNPGNQRGAFAQAVEGDRWLVTLMGMHGEQPPSDLGGFIDYARRLAASDIAELISGATPDGDAETTTYPASRRRRYERLRRFPERYVVLGDAMCSFNPIYGQGMSVAAREARILRDVVDRGLDRIGPRFFRRARRIVDIPWDQSVGADLRDPRVIGPRPLRWRLITAYLDRVFPAATRDPVVALTLFHVIGLVAAPETLMRPAVVARVLRDRRRHGAPISAGAEMAPATLAR
jgi:2-polyprenyl-6-methoxyphenol hydroxylase-like FAD-dependent oxidoreductase